MKSKFYKEIQSGKCTLKDLYLIGAKFVHKGKKTVEYIHFWNWKNEIKENHPDFSDYEIRALTFNGQIVCRGTCIDGEFRWTYPTDQDEKLYKELMK